MADKKAPAKKPDGGANSGKKKPPPLPPTPSKPYEISAALDAKIEGSPTNPPFIYPGTFTQGLFNNQINSGRVGQLTGARQVKRGYIRRLTEFYNNDPNKKANTATLNNLRCNFQFNPAAITRNIEANSNLQYFFNQEPSQLTQPIPGNAGFAFELLFNREAELNSGTYLSPDGKKMVNPPKQNRLTTNPEVFINEDYSPSWVTEIGVLADIMVLDDIVGQGLAKDVLNAVINKQGFTFDPEEAPPKEDPKDEGDKTNTDSDVTWNDERLSAFSQNLGNKAFLTPTPVRILFSPWLMVEGFVMSYQVTFNKFTPEMVPSQASVAIQMQALYVGFAQQKTLLTMGLAGGPGKPGPDIPDPGTIEREQYDQLKEALNTYVEKAAHLLGSGDDHLSLSENIFKVGAQMPKDINFIAKVSKQGRDFYDNVTNKDKGGGGLTFTFKGEVKINWNSHVTNSTVSRQQIPQNAVNPSGLDYASGPPPGSFDFSIYGTKSKPLVLTLDETPVYYEKTIFGNLVNDDHLMILGKITNGQKLRVVDGRWGLDRSAYSPGDVAMWSWELNGVRQTPFNQDKFDVSLELTLTATRNNSIVVESDKKIVGKWTGVQANDQTLFKNLSYEK